MNDEIEKDGPISQYCYLNDNVWLMPLLLYVQMVILGNISI